MIEMRYDMSVERVREYLAGYGLEGGVREFTESSATVELAARALGVQEARIAKSLTFKDADGGCIMIVAAGDVRIDNRKFKDEFGFKAKMLTAQEALLLTGHTVGGVCPFALPDGVRVFLDISLKRFDTVFPACGSASSAIELEPDELFRVSGAEKWVDIAKLAV